MAALREDVHAEAGLLSEAVGTIARSRPQEILGQPGVAFDNLQRDGLGLKRSELLHSRLDGHRHKLTRGFHLQRFIGSDVEVRHVLLRFQHRTENVIEFGFGHGHPLLTIVRS